MVVEVGLGNCSHSLLFWLNTCEKPFQGTVRQAQLCCLQLAHLSNSDNIHYVLQLTL